MRTDHLSPFYLRLIRLIPGVFLFTAILGFFAHTADAEYVFLQLEIEEGTYHAGDPVRMALTVQNRTSSTICNPLLVDVHLTPDGNFRTETDHLLTRLNGPYLGPGEY